MTRYERAQKILAAVADGPLNAASIACILYPYWRTLRGGMTQAAIGVTRKACAKLVAAGVLVQKGEGFQLP